MFGNRNLILFAKTTAAAVLLVGVASSAWAAPGDSPDAKSPTVRKWSFTMGVGAGSYETTIAPDSVSIIGSNSTINSSTSATPSSTRTLATLDLLTPTVTKSKETRLRFAFERRFGDYFGLHFGLGGIQVKDTCQSGCGQFTQLALLQSGSTFAVSNALNSGSTASTSTLATLNVGIHVYFLPGAMFNPYFGLEIGGGSIGGDGEGTLGRGAAYLGVEFNLSAAVYLYLNAGMDAQEWTLKGGTSIFGGSSSILLPQARSTYGELGIGFRF